VEKKDLHLWIKLWKIEQVLCVQKLTFWQHTEFSLLPCGKEEKNIAKKNFSFEKNTI